MTKDPFFKGFLKHHYRHKGLQEKFTTGINMQNSIDVYPLILLYIRGECGFSFLFQRCYSTSPLEKKNNNNKKPPTLKLYSFCSPSKKC